MISALEKICPPLVLAALLLGLPVSQRSSAAEATTEHRPPAPPLEKSLIVGARPIPQPKPKPPAPKGSCASEIAKHDWPQRTAQRIMQAESRGRARAVNDNPRTRDYSVGCFQINIYGRLAANRPSENWLKNPANNVAYAHEIYLSQGRQFCTSGGWRNTCSKLGLI